MQAERLTGGPVDPEYQEMYQAAEAAQDSGKAVYDRRTALGLSQIELGQRAGMTQPQVSRLETGGATPTLPLLWRLARALEADIVVRGDGKHRLDFIPRHEAACH